MHKRPDEARSGDAALPQELGPRAAAAPVVDFTASETDLSGADTDGDLAELWLCGSSSSETRRAYGRHATAFLTYLSEQRRCLRTATLKDLQNFIAAQTGSVASLRARTGAIKSLLSFGHRTGYLRFNVGAAVKVPQAERVTAERILSEPDVQRLLSLEPSLRNRALMRLLYASGAPCSELCGLRWRDLQSRDGGRGQLTVHGKGDKTRSVVVSADTWAVLQQLRDSASEGGEPSPDAPLFRSRKGGRAMAERQVHRVVKAAAERAGISGNVSPHWLRHAHASHALERGAPIHIVQATLGHASVATTGVYLHARPGDSSGLYLAV